MTNDLTGKYYIKDSLDGSYSDITTLFDGVRILTINGFFDQGKSVNVYNEQWVNSQDEDFMIPDVDNLGNPLVVRENVDIEITFIVGQRYASTTIDVGRRHDEFIRYLTKNDVWIKSKYTNKEVHCMNIDNYSPTVVKLCRGDKSFMTGTIKLHTLEKPKEIS